MSNFIKNLLTENEERSFKVRLNTKGELVSFESDRNDFHLNIQLLVDKLIKCEMIQFPKDVNFFTYFIEVWCIGEDDLYIETYYDYDNFDDSLNGTMKLSNFVNLVI
jgi:hypothetical protein